MARTLEQILSESEQYYAPQIEAIKQRKAAIPGMIESDIQSANAAQSQAYEDIITGARRRGLGFAGIPLGEQAKYASTVYAPAILAAKSRGTEYGLTLDDALNQIIENRYLRAQEQANWEKTFDENVRQANLSASASRWSPTFNTGGDNTQTGNVDPYLPKINKTDKGYQFTDSQGKPINAAQYVQLYQLQGGQLTYRQLLQQMANAGDQNAQIALNYVGDDYKFGGAPEQYRGALEALGATGTYAKAQGQPSRAQSAWNRYYAGDYALARNPVVNRLTYTPKEYMNQARSNINKVKQAYNWAFGAR